MSLSYDLPATADAFHDGILSSKVAAIFSRQPGTEILSTDRPDLLAAANLVHEILNGAKTLADRSAVTGVTSDGIRSLGLALNPLRRLASSTGGSSPTDEIIVTLLSHIHETLTRASEYSRIPERKDLNSVVREFFGLLADVMLSNIRRPRDPNSPNSYGGF